MSSHILTDEWCENFDLKLLGDFVYQETVQYESHQESYEQDKTDFKYEKNRLRSLSSWIDKHGNKEKLARYGFYYNQESDFVKCYFCEVVIGEWGIGDNPLIEHHKHSPECDFINLRATDNIPIWDQIQLRVELKQIHELNEQKTARHPYYQDESLRLESFNKWPKSSRQKPTDLSGAGFFYLEVGDQVKCYFCGGCLNDWEDNDIPMEEHKKHFWNQCNFIKTNYLQLKEKYSNSLNTKNVVKASTLQIEELVKFMDQYKELKEGIINASNNKAVYNELWATLTEHLNNLVGSRKDVTEWKAVWRNHKYNNKRKMAVNSSSELEISARKIFKK